ncbi:MAG: hypothetical protein IJ571_03100 [Ruminococcus sp.]|nr:hypothetical protein [Ruminococcus sp.]
MLRKMIHKLFKPPLKVLLTVDIIAFPLVIYALKKLSCEHPVALAAYFISAYALVISIINFKRIKDRVKALIKGDELRPVRAIKAFMRRYKYTRLYLESMDFRAEAGLYLGLVINLFYAVFKVVTGAIYDSAWLWSIGIYYLFLGGIRFFLMRGQRRKNNLISGTEIKLHEYKTYRLCGCLMMILDIAVGGMAVQMIWQNKANEFSQAAVIISAAYTFYLFVLAIYNVVSFHKRDNAILSAAKDLALTGAVMSMFSLQTSMLHAFGSADEESFRRMMNTVTGSVVMAIVLAIATYMIINGTRKTELYRKQTGDLDNG